MENVLYSNKENIVFYIPGYVDTCCVNEMIKVLEKGKQEIIKICKDMSIDEGQIQSYEIRISRRYKSMRVFYVKTPKMPEGAFSLGDDWTMDKWISF